MNKMPYWIGDIIEFYDHPVNCDKKEKTYVDRIQSLHKITHKDGSIVWELFLEVYPEVNGCSTISPDDVLRVIEKSSIPNREFPVPELNFGDRVVFTEKNKQCIDGIKYIEQIIDNGGGINEDRVQYMIEQNNYCMTPDEFDEVIKKP